MYNEVSEPSKPYEPGSYYNTLKEELGEELVKKFNPLLDELTVKQLNCLRDYISETAHKMSKEFEETVTVEDFEKAKKEDIDEDNEEGETE